jgi:hypothetical protein
MVPEIIQPPSEKLSSLAIFNALDTAAGNPAEVCNTESEESKPAYPVVKSDA